MEDKSRTAPMSTAMDDEIDLGELLGVLLNEKWRIVSVTAIAAIVGVVYALFSTPIYEADALLQVEDSSSSTPFDEIAAFMGDEAASETEIEVIRSRAVVGRVVDRLGLTTQVSPVLPVWDRTHVSMQPELSVSRFTVPQGLIGATFEVVVDSDSEYKLFLDGDVLGAGLVGQALELPEWGVGLFVTSVQRTKPGMTFELSKKGRPQVIRALQSELSVSEKGKKTGVIRVSLQGADNQRLKDILNTLANVYVQQNVERRSEEAEKSLEFLDEQLPSLRREVDAAELALNNYLSENKLVDLTAESQSVLGQLVAIEQGLSELNLKRAELEQEFNAQHPALVALSAQEKQLQAQRQEAETQIAALPDTQQEALRLKRDVEVNNVLYTFLLNKAQELRVIKAGTVGNVRVLDQAFLPYQAVKPKKALIVALAIVLGGMLGVMWVFVRRVLSQGVKSPDEIEQKLGLSVYTTIPESEAELELFKVSKKFKGKRKLLAATEPKDQAVEALRSLRTSLHFAMMGAENNRVVISGPSPGIGKSFISANLGYLLAEVDKKVVLVDADMRKGHCHEYFSAQRAQGLSEYVSGDIDDVPSLLKAHPQNAGFSLVSTGSIPPNPSELLLNERFLLLLNQLSEQFDVVIIDTPPIMAVADAAVVLPHSSAAFVVARAGMNPVGEIDAAVKRLTQDGGKVSGVLLNGLQRSTSGYGYKYGNYKYYQYDYK